MAKEIALVYMAAGLSKRFGGRIKGLVEINNGKTFIEYSLAQAFPAGFSKIIFIVSQATIDPFKEHLGKSHKGIPLFYALQSYDSDTRSKPWGTADALCSARKFLNCPLVVCNSDDLYGARAFSTLIEHLRKNTDSAAVGYKLSDNIPDAGAVNRGIFKTDSEGYVSAIDEVLGIVKNSLSEKNLNGEELCSMNIFASQLNDVELLHERVKVFKEQHAEDKTMECYLPIELCSLISEKAVRMKVYPVSEKTLGITNPGDEEDVRKALAE